MHNLKILGSCFGGDREAEFNDINFRRCMI